MMQNLFEETRKKLTPFVGEEKPYAFSGAAAAPPEPAPLQRFVSKVPDGNYKGLEKLVPISWL